MGALSAPSWLGESGGDCIHGTYIDTPGTKQVLNRSGFLFLFK